MELPSEGLIVEGMEGSEVGGGVGGESVELQDGSSNTKIRRLMEVEIPMIAGEGDGKKRKMWATVSGHLYNCLCI